MFFAKKIITLLIFAGLVFSSLLTQAHAEAGYTWTQRTGTGSGWWKNVTSSSDGTKLVTGDFSPGYIYTSSDSGATWTQRTNSGARSWNGITSSSDGTKLAAADSDLGYIYTSSDSGATWTQRTNSGARAWSGITSSSDGTKLAVVNGSSLGYIYTSSDSGATWTQQTSTGQLYWGAITSSSDGTKLAVGDTDSGYIYTGVFDLIAPTYTSYTPTPSSNTFSLSFTSDETSSSTISYGLLSGSRVATSSALNTTSHSHSLTGLLPCASYQYVMAITDTYANASSSSYTFQTTGCPTSASVATSSQSLIGTSGGTATLEDVTLTVPSGFAGTSTAFQINRLDTASVIASLGTPTSNLENVGDHIYDLSAFFSATTSTSTFNQDITLTFDYDSGDIPSTVDPSTLSIYSSDGSVWTNLSCTLDTVLTTISCPTNHFSIFGLFGTSYPVSAISESPAPNPSGGRRRTPYGLPATEVATVSTSAPLVNKISTVSRNLYFTVPDGDDIKTLQKTLNALGHTLASSGPGSPGFETNHFGGLTMKALISFQKEQGITPTFGYFGPITKAVMGKLGY
jgi:hypothetical protein